MWHALVVYISPLTGHAEAVPGDISEAVYADQHQ